MLCRVARYAFTIGDNVMTKMITVGDFLNHIQDLSYDNPDLLDMELSGLIVYIDNMDSPISITTDEE